jgi:hypothetical protein
MAFMTGSAASVWSHDCVFAIQSSFTCLAAAIIRHALPVQGGDGGGDVQGYGDEERAEEAEEETVNALSHQEARPQGGPFAKEPTRWSERCR